MDDTLSRLLSKSGGLVTHKQATALGIDAHLLGRWVREGRLERVQRGVYRQVNAPLSGFEDLVEVQLRIPYAVVCLRSALSFHQLTTFIPKAVEIAVPQKARPPRLAYPPILIHYFSASTYSYGIEEHDLGGHRVNVYSMEKTLIDLFRFSNTYGDELFAEGLKNYLARPQPNYEKLLEAARSIRVERRLKPILRIVAYNLST